MKFKPKSTVKNEYASLYRRFTDIESSATLKTVYKTLDDKFWLFNNEELAFIKLEETPTQANGIVIIDNNKCLKYKDNYYKYINNEWTSVEMQQTDILNAQFGNIAKYQTNKYYYVGTFDYVRKGEIESSETQMIKGLITPLSSFSIKYTTDDLVIDHDDLVVVNGHLYSVANPSTQTKFMPKPFNIYFCDLNSIL